MASFILPHADYFISWKFDMLLPNLFFFSFFLSPASFFLNKRGYRTRFSLSLSSFTSGERKDRETWNTEWGRGGGHEVFSGAENTLVCQGNCSRQTFLDASAVVSSVRRKEKKKQEHRLSVAYRTILAFSKNIAPDASTVLSIRLSIRRSEIPLESVALATDCGP